MELSLDQISFQKHLGPKFVDKSGIISFLNKSMENADRYYCFIRPRRFGKTYTSHMLQAYYSDQGDSHALFDSLNIAKDPSYQKHINQYSTIFLTISDYVRHDDQNGESFMQDLVKDLMRKLCQKLPKEFQEQASTQVNINDLLLFICYNIPSKFVFIIDEYDFVFRHFENNEKVQEQYIMLLTLLFKSSFGTSNVALAYMTGILPIKRYNNQSYLNNFREVSMINTYGLGKYFGFTEDEVKKLCVDYDLDFEKTKEWYDGYHIYDIDIYNPYAIIGLTTSKKFGSIWSNSGCRDIIERLLNKGFQGLKTDLSKLLLGEKIIFEPAHESFNAVYNLDSKQAIFTYLIYLGYLALTEDEVLYIPTKDVKQELDSIMKRCDF